MSSYILNVCSCSRLFSTEDQGSVVCLSRFFRLCTWPSDSNTSGCHGKINTSGRVVHSLQFLIRVKTSKRIQAFDRLDKKRFFNIFSLGNSRKMKSKKEEMSLLSFFLKGFVYKCFLRERKQPALCRTHHPCQFVLDLRMVQIMCWFSAIIFSRSDQNRPSLYWY